MVPILSALVRVVVFTPLLVFMYGVYNSPELMVAVAELDVGTVVTTIAGVPQIHIVALLAVGVSILSPYLPSGREMH